ncbi:putative transcriptional regulatory protein [Neofusicoccum parvum]|uniref:Transcriptional regulatory protein n=1 Tax=Neofusicoccum parvum TaxID=310453 RepID=A0ACB5SM60_9PEZI|nr:putative transcriptional regulatory protein [Neofusicoccum parvum]
MGDRGRPIGGPPIRPPKRKRLSRACNWCRKQKVRCDESLPSCLNCRLRNLHCLTTEPKTGAEIASTDRKHSAKHRPSPPECRSDPGSPYSSTTASTATSMLALATPGLRRTDSSSTTSTALPATSSARSLPPWTSLPTPETTFALPPASSRAGPPPSPPKPRTEPAAAAQEEPRGNAVLTPQSSDYAINYGDEPVRRKFLGASSSQVLVQWLDLSFSRRGPWPNVSQFFRYGISTAEEFTHDLWPSPNPLPPYPECAKYLSVYHSRIHPLFPVLDVPELTGIFKDLADKDPRSLSQSDLPSLACCYAVTSIGMDAISGKPSDLATEYLTSAYSLYAHTIAMPYLRSIQALLLLALALRGRHKEGVAWHVIGHAVRMAQSLGLHRHQQPDQARADATSDPARPRIHLDRNIWWSLFCLEKMMALQTGRPSAVRDEDCDQTLPSPDSPSSNFFLHYLVGLAQVQSAIAQSMNTQTNRKRSMRDFFHDVAQLDNQLVMWAEGLPDNLRPGSTLYCTPEDQPFATFFSACYHET